MTGSARILVVAGSDSGGGAGIQADIKAINALGGFATTAVTALTAQNTLGVQDVSPVAPDFIQAQMTSVLADIGADCGKTGMLHSPAVIEAVAATWREQASGVALVVDPVMVAQSGDRLLEEAAVGSLSRELIPLATVLTPNLPEAEVLAGRPLDDPEDPAGLARQLLDLGCGAVLLKGGHAVGDQVTDVLVSPGTEAIYLRYPRVGRQSFHGTGCTLASAIASGLGEGRALADAVARARGYLQHALRTAPSLGGGASPVDHGHTFEGFEVTDPAP